MATCSSAWTGTWTEGRYGPSVPAPEGGHATPAPGGRGPAPEVRHHRPRGDRAVDRGRSAGMHHPRAAPVIHSDHGVHFTSSVSTRHARDSGLAPSRGIDRRLLRQCRRRVVLGSVQTELLNRRRRHGALGVLTRSSTRCSTACNPSPETQQPDSTGPGYTIIAEALREQIRTGQLRHGDQPARQEDQARLGRGSAPSTTTDSASCSTAASTGTPSAPPVTGRLPRLATRSPDLTASWRELLTTPPRS